MQSISSLQPAALRAPEAVRGAPETTNTREAETGIRRYPEKDEYISGRETEPTGRYWLDRDGDGTPKIRTDSPEKAPDAPEASKAPSESSGAAQPGDGKAPEKKETAGETHGRIVNTDQVDREIEKLKREQEELKRKISAEQDDKKLEQLQKRLEEVERELSRKDNDAYRFQHAVSTSF